MVGRPRDTSEEAAKVQRELLLAQSLEERVHLIDSMCTGITELALAGIERQHPEASSGETMIHLMTRRYGKQFVDELPVEAIDQICRAQEQ